MRIRKISRRNCVYFFLIYCCFALTATYMFELPKYFVYTIDILNVMLAVFCLYDCGLKISKKRNRGLKTFILLLLITDLIGFVLNGQSIFLLLWGARNNYRGILFMFSCIYLMEDWQKEKTLTFLDNLFWLHTVLVLYQYFAMGYKGDCIGGIFGVTQGGNSGNNLMLCICVSIAFWKYLNERSNIPRLLIRLGCCFCIAAFAELKIFFVEIILIAAVFLALNGRFSKKIKSILVLTSGLILGLYVLYSIFPQWTGYFTIEHMLKLLEGGRGLGGTSIDRFSGLPELYDIFYSGKGLKCLFGYGLGSADYSLSIDLFKSSIYIQYYFIGYSTLSYAFLFIELGIIGFVLFLTLLFLPVWTAFRRRNQDTYSSLVIVMGIICLMLLFYDVTMKIEPQYFAYFILSMPFWKEAEENGRMEELYE